MTPDFALPARRAIVHRLKSAGEVTSLIDVERIFGGTVPAKPPFPFVRTNPPITTPFRASGLDTASFRFTVQAFTQGVTIADVLTVGPEDHAYQIGSAFKDALDGTTLPLEGGMKLRLTWVSTIATIDGAEPSAWAVTSIFTGDVSA